MVNEFTKQHRAERIARSQFKPGTLVAVVEHGWDRRIVGRRAVDKVYVTGNFTIGDKNRQWVPDYNGDRAHPAGKPSGFRHTQHLEIWTEKHDAEIAAHRSARDRSVRSRVAQAVLEFERDRLPEHTLLAIEAALGLVSRPANEAEAD